EPDGDVIKDYFPAVLTEAEFYAAQRGRDSRRPVLKESSPVELETVRQLHEQNKSVTYIARELGINRNKVYRALIKLGARKAPSGEKPQGIYLFNGMVYAPDRRRYVLATWISRERPYKILLLKGEDSITFPYFVLERAILHELREINPKEILDGA